MPTILITELQKASWQTPTTKFVIDGHIDVWRISIAAAESFLSMLTLEELAKKDRFRNQQNRDEFITGRGALRYLSGKYFDKSPLDLVLQTGENGKPCWEKNTASPLFFNIAHSADDVLIAFANTELGIDVEKIKPAFDYSGILSRCFAPAETQWVLSATDQLSAFYRLWTRKEAILKATGIGVHNDLHLVPSIDGTYFVDESSVGSKHDLTVSSFTIADNVMAAIAHDPTVMEICFYDLFQI